MAVDLAQALLIRPVNAENDFHPLKIAITNRLNYGRQYWNPLHQRQDYWAQMYQLLDVLQQMKPLGYRRFISNQPRTAIDAVVSIGTRNETTWRIDAMGSVDEVAGELRNYGKIERTLSGIVYAIDGIFGDRGEPRFWKQVWFNAALRGWVWGKAHITTAALDFCDTPIIAEVYDPRLCYPFFDSFGLNSIIIEKPTTLGNLCVLYPEQFADLESASDYDPYRPATKIEFWSNNRGQMPGIYACLAIVGQKADFGAYQLLQQASPQTSRWVQTPYIHGYTPRQLPVFGVPVNGINIKVNPPVNTILESRLAERSDLLALQAASWHQRDSAIANSGRGLLSAVEDHIPQYNELIATVFQHLSIGTYGTWIAKTPTGEFPKFRPGIEARVALKPEESLQRLTMEPVSPDAYRLVQILQDEKQQGTLANILQAASGFTGTGVLFQQMANAALNAIEPYHDGVEEFGIRFGEHVLAQLQAASGTLRKFEIVSGDRKRSPFRIEFDPRTDLDRTRHYRPYPIAKPALPDDLSVRATAARLMLDPRRPILSLRTVLEEILQLDDPDTEMDRIWEDIAQTDPVIVLEQIASALERRGEAEMAARIRENEFRTAFLQDLQFRQATGNIPGGPGGFANPGPEAGANPFNNRQDNTTTNEPARLEGAQLVGGLGINAGV